MVGPDGGWDWIATGALLFIGFGVGACVMLAWVIWDQRRGRFLERAADALEHQALKRFLRRRKAGR